MATMKIHTVALTAEDAFRWRTDKAYRAKLRYQARHDAREAGCTAYRVMHCETELHMVRLPALTPKPAPRPRGKLTPEAVEAAYREHGPRARKVLRCSKQAIYDRDDLRAARARGIEAHPGMVTERVRVPRALAARLAKLAGKAGQSRQVYAGRLLAALETLPAPIPGGSKYGALIPILLPVADRDRLRALAGEDFAGCVRAALEKA
jgi:hypothetical protein